MGAKDCFKTIFGFNGGNCLKFRFKVKKDVRYTANSNREPRRTESNDIPSDIS